MWPDQLAEAVCRTKPLPLSEEPPVDVVVLSSHMASAAESESLSPDALSVVEDSIRPRLGAGGAYFARHGPPVPT